jgi:hypothetical protein
MVDMAQRHSLQNQISNYIRAKTIHHCFHTAQIAQPLLTGICHEPYIATQFNILLTQHPH